MFLNSDEMSAFVLQVKGKVQGVWYRVSARKKAELLGVRGYVKNLSDGSVKVVVEGDDEKVREFIEWCKRGPELARVEDISMDTREAEGYRKFEIRR